MSVQITDYSGVNFEEMAASIGLKAKHMPILIGSFLDESKMIIVSLREAIDSGDFENMKLHSHSIKGSAGNLKFSEIYEMAREMEFASADKNSDFDYSGYLDAIEASIATIPN